MLPPGLGFALREAREARGLSRREVAASTGIRPRTLARIERCAQCPSWPTLERLCDHLEVNVAAVAPRWLKDSFDVPTSPTEAPGVGLRALRRERGLTLAAVAAGSGVSAATLSRFERGITASRLLGPQMGVGACGDEDLARLAKVFGLSDGAALWQACLVAADGD
nr:helix-turn-helix transcriptional regulator [Sphingomonas sp. JXJ CY 53]